MTLSTDNLSITRGGNLVVNQVTTALESGAITAIVGPNGAGKSSLLMGLAGLLKPAAGSVTMDGESLSAMQPSARAKRLGYLPQEAEVAWDVSVEALVALGRLPHRDARREPVEAAIAALDLEALLHRPVSQLSGGERARVLLARVLAGEPQWILADEPLAALDLAHQVTLVKHLRSTAAQGAGIVVVLHDLAIAMNYADRVLVLREGRLVADGAPNNALSQETIANVWGVEAEWKGEPGRRALTVRSHG